MTTYFIKYLSNKTSYVELKLILIYIILSPVLLPESFNKTNYLILLLRCSLWVSPEARPISVPLPERFPSSVDCNNLSPNIFIRTLLFKYENHIWNIIISHIFPISHLYITIFSNSIQLDFYKFIYFYKFTLFYFLIYLYKKLLYSQPYH